MVKENTEDWTWDGLLRDVARDFQEEAERNQVMKEKKAAFREEVRHEVRGHGRSSVEKTGQGRAAGRAQAQEGGG